MVGASSRGEALTEVAERAKGCEVGTVSSGNTMWPGIGFRLAQEVRRWLSSPLEPGVIPGRVILLFAMMSTKSGSAVGVVGAVLLAGEYCRAFDPGSKIDLSKTGVTVDVGSEGEVVPAGAVVGRRVGATYGMLPSSKRTEQSCRSVHEVAQHSQQIIWSLVSL